MKMEMKMKMKQKMMEMMMIMTMIMTMMTIEKEEVQKMFELNHKKKRFFFVLVR